MVTAFQFMDQKTNRYLDEEVSQSTQSKNIDHSVIRARALILSLLLDSKSTGISWCFEYGRNKVLGRLAKAK